MAKSKMLPILLIAVSLLVTSFAGCAKKEVAEPIEDLTQRYENVTRLTTDPANDRNPVWSPDGSKLLFKRSHSTYDGRIRHYLGGYICVMDSDGRNVKNLTEGEDSFSTGRGTEVFFSRRMVRVVGNTLFFTRSIVETREVEVGTEPFQTGYELWSISLDGGNLEKISECKPELKDAETKLDLNSWSKDGKRAVLYTLEDTGHVWLNMVDGTWKWAEQAPSEAEVGPGHYPKAGIDAIYAEYIPHIWVWDVESDVTRRIISLQPWTMRIPFKEEIRWSPDGRRIALSDIEIVDGQAYEHVYVIDVESGEKEKLTSYPGVNNFPAWSPDGRKIMYLRSEGRGRLGFPVNPDIWVMNADDSDKKQLTDSPMSEDAWWSPDGARIAYIVYSQGIFDEGKKSKEDKSEIWVMNTDGSDKQLLLSVPYQYGLIEELEWSPDGTRLAFVWDPNVEGVDKDIYLIDVPDS